MFKPKDAVRGRRARPEARGAGHGKMFGPASANDPDARQPNGSKPCGNKASPHVSHTLSDWVEFASRLPAFNGLSDAWTGIERTIEIRAGLSFRQDEK